MTSNTTKLGASSLSPEGRKSLRIPIEQTTSARQFGCHSRDFLLRAEELVEHFAATGDERLFFYASLELRFAIEARLHEVISASAQASGAVRGADNEYSATRLLRRLAVLNPAASIPVKISVDNHIEVRRFEYEPVTNRLASIHGQLGALLHYNYFLAVAGAPKMVGPHHLPREALAEKVALLREGAAELHRSLSSNMLVTPEFMAIMEKFIAENGGAGKD